jgi:dihydroorotate dehydrogenase (NAD+) catalytic subunit
VINDRAERLVCRLELLVVAHGRTTVAQHASEVTVAPHGSLEIGVEGAIGHFLDVQTSRPVIGNVQGGLSGPAIRPIALLKVHQVYQEARRQNIPIIGQGGIETAADAIEFLLAGSTTIGLGTALFYNPLAAQDINRDLAAHLTARGIDSVTRLIGAMNTGQALDLASSG